MKVVTVDLELKVLLTWCGQRDNKTVYTWSRQEANLWQTDHAMFGII